MNGPKVPGTSLRVHYLNRRIANTVADDLSFDVVHASFASDMPTSSGLAGVVWVPILQTRNAQSDK